MPSLLLLYSDVEYMLNEIAGKIGLPLSMVQREVTRVSGSGLTAEGHYAIEEVVRARLVLSQSSRQRA